MHGLINRAIQSFVCNTYGPARWQRVAEAAGLDSPEFEPMLIYDDAESLAVLDALCRDLGRKRPELLEDLGTFLVSHPQTEALRRRLFRPFVRGEHTGNAEGLGLGLVLVQALASAQGGAIRYSDAPTGGAVFTVSFPR